MPIGRASDQAKVEALRQQLSASGSQVLHRLADVTRHRDGLGHAHARPEVDERVGRHLRGGLQVSVRLEGDRVWESGGAGYGMVTDAGPDGSGQPLSGFASLVDGHARPRARARWP